MRWQGAGCDSESIGALACTQGRITSCHSQPCIEFPVCSENPDRSLNILPLFPFTVLRTWLSLGSWDTTSNGFKAWGGSVLLLSLCWFLSITYLFPSWHCYVNVQLWIIQVLVYTFGRFISHLQFGQWRTVYLMAFLWKSNRDEKFLLISRLLWKSCCLVVHVSVVIKPPVLLGYKFVVHTIVYTAK